jgi:hypothetical protein
MPRQGRLQSTIDTVCSGEEGRVPADTMLKTDPKEGRHVREIDRHPSTPHPKKADRHNILVLKDSATRFLTSGFFQESVSPKVSHLGPFRFFSKIRGDIRS